ncbi:COP9 signalosome complex subunit 7b [Gracilariopsis chorda]|uniref:COP9 signalosome complex subunit 7b n=1 Tax=Gracilariopsis chorda TaxID=448386 RepID=A0A2V3J079_9FLOR|nr:COP9 signalosome complex subunit 7b [Gracilariopsis chorda]|eukprot:PXF47801.1 COP9 signalosome complex subunit 7b [Gracilariopsis chorda]
MSSPSSDALVHYLSLARLASAESAAQICVEATEDPNLYVFSELLCLPCIQALHNNGSWDKFFQLLCLFAHGTVQDYHQNRAIFPPLSEAHMTKLRTLTLVSLAYGDSELQYAQLREASAVSAT